MSYNEASKTAYIYIYMPERWSEIESGSERLIQRGAPLSKASYVEIYKCQRGGRRPRVEASERQINAERRTFQPVKLRRNIAT